MMIRVDQIMLIYRHVPYQTMSLDGVRVCGIHGPGQDCSRKLSTKTSSAGRSLESVLQRRRMCKTTEEEQRVNVNVVSRMYVHRSAVPCSIGNSFL